MNETTAALEDSGDKIDQPRPPISKRPLRQLNSKERHKVFISYRDTDSAGITGRIYADLTKRFGKKTVFRAPDSIEPSAKWPASIIRTLSETAVMLVVIGPRWLDSKDKDGKRRLDNPEDWVRREIEAAFKDHMAVIPVLLDATSVPDREALPESLQPLVDIMTVPVRDGRHFSRDMRDLIQLITLKISAISRRRLIVLGGLTAAAAAISGGVIWLWIKRSQPPPSPSSHLMVWSYTIPASPKFQGDADTGVIARPAEADGIAYILSTNGTIYALDARTGDLIWHSIDLKLTGAPAVTRGVVCAPSSEGTICGFDSSKGTLLWTTSAAHKFSLSAGASVTAIDGFVYAGSDDGNIYAFDATMEGGGALQWQALTPGRASLSSPTVADGQSGPLLLVASDDGIAYSFDAIHGGGPLWQRQVGTWVFSAPGAADGIVYAGSVQGHITALDVSLGTPHWISSATASGLSPLASPVVADGIVYVASDNGNIYALSAIDGRELWRASVHAGLFSVPARARGNIYVGSNDGNLYALDATSGRENWRVKPVPDTQPPPHYKGDTTPDVLSSPVVVSGIVYVGASVGEDICICRIDEETSPSAIHLRRSSGHCSTFSSVGGSWPGASAMPPVYASSPTARAASGARTPSCAPDVIQDVIEVGGVRRHAALRLLPPGGQDRPHRQLE